MAVVFISPKQRQKVFFMGITIIFLLFLAVIASAVFFSKPKEVPYQLVFNKPKIDINFDVLDSAQFKELEPFTEMEMQFNYRAETKAGKIIAGLISANSMDEARGILKNIDLTVIDIKEVEVGRENPFAPYFQTTAPSKTTTKK